MELLLLFVLLLIISLCVSVLYWYCTGWLRAWRIKMEFRRQGIGGPPPSLFPFGNLPEMRKAMLAAAGETTTTWMSNEEGRHSTFQDYSKKLYPYFLKWRKLYGPTYLYWIGGKAAVYTSDPGIVREISHCVSLDLGKPKQLQKAQEPLFGQGIIKSNGALWAHQRKILAPALFMDKIKVMVDAMNKSAIPLLTSWEKIIDDSGGGGGSAEIAVEEHFRVFSADVISRVCFGSDYLRGKEIFLKLRVLARVIATSSLDIPYMRFLPTRKNRMIRRLEREVRSLILDVVEEQKKKKAPTTASDSIEKDILGLILQSDDSMNSVGGNPNFRSGSNASEFMVDNCKSIYFAGHETTAVTATWCMMLLAGNPAWQDRARAEVAQVCKGQPPDFQTIKEMKTLTMIIYETLRLFPPSAFVAREVFEDMKFGNLHIPRGTNIWMPISTMHQDQAAWGPKADMFDPGRFAHGVSRACKHPHMYAPFGLGARTCLGQNLAMVELKVILALILSKFTFTLSQSYRHSPANRLIIEPEFGLPLTISKLQ